MSINAKNKGKEFELVPAGLHVARCYRMIEIGTVVENVMGSPKKLTKCMISWELPEELREFDKEKGMQPMTIHQEYTLSMNEKSNLRKMLTSWRGKGFTESEAESFDITVLVGVPCMLNIAHEPKKSDPSTMIAKISAVTAIPKGTKPPKGINPLGVLSYDDFDQALFESLPEFIQKKIKSSDEYIALNTRPSEKYLDSHSHSDSVSEIDDDLPF